MSAGPLPNDGSSSYEQFYAFVFAAQPTTAHDYVLPAAGATLLYSGGPLGTPSSASLSGAFLTKAVIVSSSGTTVAGQLTQDPTQLALSSYLGAMRGMYSRVLFTQTATVTVTASTVNTTETTLTGAGIGTLTLPASFFAVVGKTLRIRAEGIYTTSGTPVTGRIKLKMTGTSGATLGDTGVMDFNSAGFTSATNKRWVIDATVTCRSSTTVFFQGDLKMTNTAGGLFVFWEMLNTTTTGVTLANSQPLDLTMTYGGNTAGNSFTMTNLSVEELN